MTGADASSCKIALLNFTSSTDLERASKQKESTLFSQVPLTAEALAAYYVHLC